MNSSKSILSSSLARRTFSQRLATKPNVILNLGRQTYSSTSRTAEAASNSSRLGAFLGIAAASGLAGYFVATQFGSTSTRLDSLVNPKYATKAQVQEGVKELQSLLPVGGVSTDPDVLKVHGFSVRHVEKENT
jgi:hypothetical protein